MIRQALIPAAGRGARLDRPNTPKPLVDVGGQPMVVRLLRQLEGVGIEKVVVVVGFEGPKVERALAKYELDTEVVFVHNTAWELGIASSVLAGRDHISERFLLAMADHVYDDALLEQMANRDVPAGSAAALIETDMARVFALDTAVKVRLSDGYVTVMEREMTEIDGVDAGLFNLPPDIFETMATRVLPGQENELADAFQPLVSERKMLAELSGRGVYDNVDTPAALVHAEMRLRGQRRRAHVAPRSRAGKFSFRTYRYAPAMLQTTDMVIGRGLLRDPSRVPLIPDSAASSPVFVFTDENVATLYGHPFVARLKQMGYDVHLIVLPGGESAKSLVSYAFRVERVLSLGVDERSRFISLGGGVVCNVCGFVASTIYRGLDLVHIPTTLMSQCDAAISHKQGINGHQGKNLVGTYYIPKLVAVDVETLATLPERLLFDGMAEVIKHALGQDPGYVDFLLSHGGDIRDVDFQERVIETNIGLKCELVASDPKELREGIILQYGHTIGHAVEHLTGYKLYHGESVAVGMMVAAEVAKIMGACDKRLIGIHERLLRKYHLPTRVPAAIRARDVLDALRYSKRYLTEGIRMALLREVGTLWSVDDDYAIPVSCDVLAEAIAGLKEV